MPNHAGSAPFATSGQASLIPQSERLDMPVSQKTRNKERPRQDRPTPFVLRYRSTDGLRQPTFRSFGLLALIFTVTAVEAHHHLISCLTYIDKHGVRGSSNAPLKVEIRKLMEGLHFYKPCQLWPIREQTRQSDIRLSTIRFALQFHTWAYPAFKKHE